jgi:hypothetical protein
MHATHASNVTGLERQKGYMVSHGQANLRDGHRKKKGRPSP